MATDPWEAQWAARRLEGCSGDALETLATAGAVPPADVLPVGLTILSALAELCRSDSPSIIASTVNRSTS